MEEVNKNENLLEKKANLDEQEIEKMEEEYPDKVKEYGFINKDPYTSSNFISGLIYYWAYKIIKLSQYINLKSEYLGKLTGDYTSKNYLYSIKNIWDNKGYKLKKSMALLKAGFRANIQYIIIILFLSLIRSVLSIIQISLFREFMTKFSSNNEEKENNYFNQFTHIQIGLMYLISKFLEIFLQRKCFENQMFLGYKSGTEISSLIYEKLLKVSPSSMKKKATTGEITNFIQVDSQKLTILMLLSPDVLTMPVLIVVYSYMLFKFMGIAFLYGIFSMILFSVFTSCFFQTINFYMKKLSSLRDSRMRIITETFNNIKILKLYSWEDEFMKRINNARENELNVKKSSNKLFNMAQGIGYLSPVITSATCIGVYQYINNKIKIEDIFTCLNILASLQMPLVMIPLIFNLFLQTVVSMGRIEQFLSQDEINPNNVINDSIELNNNNIAIKVENGFYSWGVEFEDLNYSNEQNIKLQKKESKITFGKKKSFRKKTSELIKSKNEPEEILKNLNFEIKKGEFIIIIGEVGSGKSSLLQAILNNMLPTKENSKIYINGSISYVRQIPWIQNDTVRNNILFFQKRDDIKYKKIIDITELKTDLEILSGGDLTEIGEKGVNLSGGQKARIALARALYSDKDIYFLDDPISALDANVGMKIMKNCIINYLKGKTRILVTHSLQYVPFADRIIYMKDGEIHWFGNYEEIKNEYFYKDFYEKSKNPLQKKNSALQRKEFLERENESDDEEIENNNNKEIKRITQDEELKSEEVKPEVYKKYITYIGGIKIIILYIIFLLIINALRGASDIWLGYWSEHQNKNINIKYFIVYCLFGILGGLFNYFNSILTSLASLHLSGIIHKEMMRIY